MVLLVRCRDNTCSLALRSHLNELVRSGLITAYLRNGEWISVSGCASLRASSTTKQPQTPSPSVAATL